MASTENPEQIKQIVKQHWVIAGLLFTLILISIGIAQIPFVTWAHMAIGLGISFVMASLVLWFFMHLSNERKLIYQVMVFSVIFSIVLVALSLLAYFDHSGYNVKY
ncbi:MAG: cytochrome C oxidase subunit IV family protein [Blastochloris sp.]|nr:cytochrome C oxidase subunit IV family protein [Blastochloris sp.]